ncbi:MAG TPA: AAA family ATPase [Clostridiales bacterium]|jgi:septum site-determining protein MinD|nr:AAA family ATPase [Clostridiales bacterium]
MSQIFVICSGKGGVGKSTVAAMLGQILADRDKKVLLTDSDSGLSGLDVMLNVGESVVFSWADVIKEVCSLDEAIFSVNDNLDLLPAPSYFADDISSEEFGELFEASGFEKYDYIFIDAPAGIGAELERACTPADYALIVTTPDNISAKAARAVRDKIDSLGVKQALLIINRFRKKPTLKCDYLNIDDTINIAQTGLIGVIPEDYKIQIIALDEREPKVDKRTISAFERIAGRVLGENIPLGVKKLK